MQDAKYNWDPSLVGWKKYGAAALVLLAFILAAGAYLIFHAGATASGSQSKMVISQAVLERDYGVRINLLALTAAGGMVDLRLKIVDAEKAKLLLQDKANFPALRANENGTTLNAPEETKSQVIKFEANNGIYLLFPNSGNAVKSGSNVSVLFGNLWIEPIVAR